MSKFEGLLAVLSSARLHTNGNGGNGIGQIASVSGFLGLYSHQEGQGEGGW